MTEDEAKKKWCPFVRQSATWKAKDGNPGFGFAYNRSAVSPHVAAPCIGSECMAWQWARRQMVREFEPEHGGSPDKRRGHCGLVADGRDD